MNINLNSKLFSFCYPTIQSTRSTYIMKKLPILLTLITLSSFAFTQSVTIKDSDDETLMIVNDEGEDKSSITIQSSGTPPDTPADKLYNEGGTLKWSGNALSTGGNTLDQAYDEGGSGSGRTITADAGAFNVGGVDGALFTGTYYTSGIIPVEGAGTRMMWYPKKAAFRAGYVNDTQWNDVNIGDASIAMGYNTIASGFISTAMGNWTTASGEKSTAMGGSSIASGDYSTAMGAGPTASGDYSTAMGSNATASGTASIAMGWETTASVDYSTAMGYGTKASGTASTAMGSGTTASETASTAMGAGTTASGNSSTAIGYNTTASGFISTAMGFETKAESSHSVAIGKYNVGGGNATSWVSGNPLFEIGIGADADNKANAVTVLKDGKVGIGITNPSATLQVDGTTKIGTNANVVSITDLIELTGTTANTNTTDISYPSGWNKDNSRMVCCEIDFGGWRGVGFSSSNNISYIFTTISIQILHSDPNERLKPYRIVLIKVS